MVDEPSLTEPETGRLRRGFAVAMGVTTALFLLAASGPGVPVTPFTEAPPRPSDSDDIVPRYPHYGYYNYLTDGFTQGRLSIPLTPRPELATLPNPYDPQQNAPYRQNDAVYFRGRYYLYFGPVPALLLFMPPRLLGLRITEALATAIFAAGAVAAQAALLRALLQRYAPALPPRTLALFFACLALGTGMPALLCYPAIYQVALASEQCMVFAALALFWRGSETGSLRAFALGSLAFGLAVGCRPTALAAAPLLALFAFGPWRAAQPDPRSWLAAVLGPAALCGALLAAYNYARFGSAFEFGFSYLLTEQDPRQLSSFTWDNLRVGSYQYLFSPWRWSALFPFVLPRGRLPESVPAGYNTTEMVGALALAPVVLAAFAIPSLFPGHDARGRGDAWVPKGFLALGLGLPLLLAAAYPFAQQRYQADFAGLLMVAGLLAWSQLLGAEVDEGQRRARRWAFHALAALTLVAGASMASGGRDGFARLARPELWRGLDATFEGLSDALASATHGDAPALLEVRDAPLTLHADRTRVWTTVDEDARIALWLPREGEVQLQLAPTAVPARVRAAGYALAWCDGDRLLREGDIAALSAPVRLGRGLHRLRVLEASGDGPRCAVRPRAVAVSLRNATLRLDGVALAR